MRGLLHYQHPQKKWHICHMDEPTRWHVNITQSTEFALGFTFALHIPWVLKRYLMKCNKPFNMQNRFTALKILCAPSTNSFLVTTHLSAATIVLSFPEYHTIGIIPYDAFLVCLFTLSNIHLGFPMSSQVFSFNFISLFSFFQLNNISLPRHTTVYLIHSPAEEYLGHFQVLEIIKKRSFGTQQCASFYEIWMLTFNHIEKWI